MLVVLFGDWVITIKSLNFNQLGKSMKKQRKAINAVTPAHRDRSLKDRPGEQWLPIPHLEKFLLVSNHGRVKRLERITVRSNGAKSLLKERIMLPAIN